MIIACDSFKFLINDILRDKEYPIIYMPPLLHFYPEKIQLVLDGLLAGLRGIYNTVVVCGKCTPAIDDIVNKYGSVRVPGEFCYEMIAGTEEFLKIAHNSPGTYFLTDDLCLNFETLVIEPLAWRKSPKIKVLMLKNYKKVVYFDATSNGALDKKAEDIAIYLNLPLEIKRVGSENFKNSLLNSIKNAQESL